MAVPGKDHVLYRVQATQGPPSGFPNMIVPDWNHVFLTSPGRPGRPPRGVFNMAEPGVLTCPGHLGGIEHGPPGAFLGAWHGRLT
eukprot:7695965-Pyramimonas_sp.AAC.1